MPPMYMVNKLNYEDKFDNTVANTINQLLKVKNQMFKLSFIVHILILSKTAAKFLCKKCFSGSFSVILFSFLAV